MTRAALACTKRVADERIVDQVEELRCDVRRLGPGSLQRDDAGANEHERLTAALAKLDERSRVILSRRWLAEDKATLHELAAEYGVSAERVRQIEANAIGKLKKQLAAA